MSAIASSPRKSRLSGSHLNCRPSRVLSERLKADCPLIVHARDKRPGCKRPLSGRWMATNYRPARMNGR